MQFVAEVSSNHHQDLGRCFAFIEKAAEIGCTGVKFQLFCIRELFAPEILARSKRHRDRARWELPTAFLPELAARCRANDVDFLCTPFYLEAVDELYPHVAAYKIASYELLWHDLLRACARTGKPVILSTGMATLDEIRAAVEAVREAGCQDLTLLHAVSAYPTPPVESNLGAIMTIRNATGCPVGWSDHTVSPAVIYRAIHHFGASMIEFHLDLDGKGEEYKTGHCWLPGQFAPVIATVRAGFEADGTGEKLPAASERQDREWRADPIDGLRPLLHVRNEWSARP